MKTVKSNSSGQPQVVPLSTSITRSGSTATATTAQSHGLSTGDKVSIRGAGQPQYNGVGVVVTVTGDTTFTYSVAGEPASPATGTITTKRELGAAEYEPHALVHRDSQRLLTDPNPKETSDFIDDTDEHEGDWRFIKAMEDTIVAEMDSTTMRYGAAVDGVYTVLLLPIPAGDVIYGRFSRIELTSGKVVAYDY